MFSQSAEYVLRAMVMLAAEDDRASTAPLLAGATGVPPDYLAKLLQMLARAGLVRSRRGLHGGFALARPPEKITVWDCIAAVDRPRRILSCPLGLPVHRSRLCPLHRRLDNAMAHVEDVFRHTTLAEIVREGGGMPLCDEHPNSAGRARRKASRGGRRERSV